MSPYYIMYINSRDDYRLLFFAVVRFFAGAAFLTGFRLAAALVVVRLRAVVAGLRAVVVFFRAVVVLALARLFGLVALTFLARLVVLLLDTVLPRLAFVVLRTTGFLTTGATSLTATTARFVNNTSAL